MKMRVVQVNLAFDDRITDPDALLEQYWTLTGWSEAVTAAGADAGLVIQRFSRNARVVRNGIGIDSYRMHLRPSRPPPSLLVTSVPGPGLPRSRAPSSALPPIWFT